MVVSTNYCGHIPVLNICTSVYTDAFLEIGHRHTVGIKFTKK